MAVKASATITLTRVNDGAQGPAGKGIKSTAITYQAGTSGTSKPTGTWSSSIPSVPQGQYLWSRTVITYTDNTTSTTYSVAYIPKNGQNGATGETGATGTGVESIVQQYYLSTSKTSQTGGSWVTSMPTWSSGKYLWTRYQINYKNPTSTAYTSPVCDSSWEAVNEIQIGGRNLAQKTSSQYSEQYTSFSGVANTCISVGRVLTDGLNIGDTVTVRLIYKYTDIVPASGQTAKFHLQGNGNVTDWNDGKFNSSPNKTISGTGEVEILYRFSISANHLKNAYWYTNLRHDYVQSGSIQWKMYKVEKGNRATDWTPAPEDVQADIEQVRTDYKAELKIERDRITSSVSEISKLNSKTSTLEQTAKGLTLRLDQTDKNVSDAAKTATNYISADGQGITIGDMSGETLGSNVRIDTDSLDIRSGDTILAQYTQNKIMLGVNSPTTTIDFFNGKAFIRYSENSEGSFTMKDFGIIANEADIGIYGNSRVHLGTTSSKSKLSLSDTDVDLFIHYDNVNTGGSLNINNYYGITLHSTNTVINFRAEKYVSGGYDGVYLTLDPDILTIDINTNYFRYRGTNGFSIVNDMATSWVDAMKGNKAGLSIDTAGATSSYNALARVKTADGAYALGAYNQDSSFRIIYGNESRLNSGTNGCDATWTFDRYGFFNTYAMKSGFIELSRVQPYIDFHYNNSNADFTSRIIESGNGVLNINNVEIHKSKVIRYPMHGSAIIWVGTDRDFGIASLSNGATLNLYMRNHTSSGWTSSIILADNGGVQIAPKNHSHDRIMGNPEFGFTVGSEGNLRPLVANSQSVGTSNYYIKDLNYGGALSKRSDRRIKNDLGNLSFDEALKILRDLSIKKYTLKDDAKEIIHYGAFAQDVRDLLLTNDIGYTSMISITEIDDDENCHNITQLDYPEDKVTYSLDYVELMIPVIVGWQYHDKKIAELEQKIASLTQSRLNLEMELRQKLSELESKLIIK